MQLSPSEKWKTHIQNSKIRFLQIVSGSIQSLECKPHSFAPFLYTFHLWNDATWVETMFFVKSADSIRQNVRREPSSAHAHQHRLYSLADHTNSCALCTHTIARSKRLLNSKLTIAWVFPATSLKEGFVALNNVPDTSIKKLKPCSLSSLYFEKLSAYSPTWERFKGCGMAPLCTQHCSIYG